MTAPTTPPVARPRRAAALAVGALALVVPLVASCEPTPAVSPAPGPPSAASRSAMAAWVADHLPRWNGEGDAARTARLAADGSPWRASDAAALEAGGRRLAARWVLRTARGGAEPSAADASSWGARLATGWTADRVVAHVVAARSPSASDAEWLRIAAAALLGRGPDRPLDASWLARTARDGRASVALGLARSSEGRRALARSVDARVGADDVALLARLLADRSGDVPWALATLDARSAPPVARSGRRVAAVGSSLAWQLGGGPIPAGVRRTAAGPGQTSVPCDWSALPFVTRGRAYPADATCSVAPQRIADYVRRTNADAVIFTYGLRSLFDLQGASGTLRHGTPEHTTVLEAGIRRHLAAIRAARPDARIWLQEVACHRLQGVTTAGEERDATRLRATNQVLRRMAAEHPGVAVLPYAAQVCEGGGTQPIAAARPDGAHLTEAAQLRWWREAAALVDAG